MRRAFAFAFAGASVMAMVAGASAAGTMIRSPDAAEPIELVEHVDVLPDHMAQAKDAISAYIREARREPGALRIDAMQEVLQNHFDLVEVWRDEAAYRAHQASPATLRFRGVITPWLGSPLDERIGTPVMSSDGFPNNRDSK